MKTVTFRYLFIPLYFVYFAAYVYTSRDFPPPCIHLAVSLKAAFNSRAQRSTATRETFLSTANVIYTSRVSYRQERALWGWSGRCSGAAFLVSLCLCGWWKGVGMNLVYVRVAISVHPAWRCAVMVVYLLLLQ